MEILPSIDLDLAREYVDNFVWETGTTPFSSVQFLVAVHVVYGVTITALSKFMSNPKRQTPSFVKPVGFVHNLMMSFLSLAMLLGLVWGGYQQGRFASFEALTCGDPDSPSNPGLVQFSVYVFYLSKMLEFIDTMLLILSKKKLIWLHKIHHLTTMSLVWHALHVQLANEIVCAALNCFVHVIMYFYFAIPVKSLRSSITATQISQFLIVLAALIFAVYRRFVVEQPCRGTFTGELHGLLMYGLYLVMFANFFITQYLKKASSLSKNNSSANDKTSRATAATNVTNAKGKTAVGGELLLLPDEFFEPSLLNALRVLAKTIAILAAGIVCAGHLPDLVGVPMGVFLIATAMSWTYVIGQDCGRGSFFPDSTANNFVGTLALIPLLRPLAAVIRDSKSPGGPPHSLWFERLFHKFIGFSVSHIGVYTFLALFVPIMIAKLGVWGLMKYWLIPFVVMHLNMGTLSATKGSRPSYMLLFPELHSLVSSADVAPHKQPGKAPRKSKKSKSAARQPNHKAPKELTDVPVYRLEPAADWLLNKTSASPPTSPRHGSTSDDVPGSGFVDSVWSYSGAKFVTRELLLWKKRDLVLYAIVGVSMAAFLHPQLSGLETVLACLSFAALMPFLLVRTRVAQRAREIRRRDRVALIDEREGRMTDDGVALISKVQLAAHPEWVAVEGNVYDLAAFAPKHPGGDLIRSMGGTEATALFHSMHPYTADKNLKVFNKYKVGQLIGEEKFHFDYRSPFALELKETVKQLIGTRTWFAPWMFWTRTCMIAAGTLYSEYVWATTGNLWAMVAAGVLHAMIGLAVQHDASHGAMSSNPTINAIFSYGADWVGNSRWLWMQQHIIGHHPHTNIEGEDPDAHSAEPLINFHIFPTVVRKWFHQYQWLYMYLVLPWYGPTVVYNLAQLFTLSHGETPENPFTDRQIPFAIATRMFYYARIVAVPYYLGVASLSTAALGVPMVAGFCLTFVFVVSHNFEDSERFPYPKDEASPTKKVDWYKLQAETSCSYGGFLSMFFTGGLNFQIEHHLFPRLSSWYYPEISTAVKSICDKHGVRYVYYPTLVHNVLSCIKYMRRTGASQDDRVPEEIENAAKKQQSQPTSGASQCYYMEDTVRAANEMDVLPVTVDGVTYNVKKWLPYHPGGDIILHYVGRDASDVFHAMHGKDALKSLQRMPKLDDSQATLVFRGKGQTEQRQKDHTLSPAQERMEVDFRKLRDEFDAEGLMDASLTWYAYKTITTVAIGVAGMFLYMKPGALIENAWANTVASSLLMGLSFQQLGWLAHEFCHHCCFENRTLNTYMGYFLGNFSQGFSVLWWRTRHNEHHGATNILEHDPDIDNLPLIAWSEHDVRVAMDTWSPGWLCLMKYQHYYFLPVIATLLHVIWEFQSILYVKNMFASTNKYYRKMAKLEAASLLGHWVWRLTFLCTFSPTVSHGLLHFWITEFVGGFGIAVVVFCNHYPLEKLHDDGLKCFPEMQVKETVNVAQGLLNDWFCGGLNYQIEHHLFPTMPRHNLRVVTPRIKQYCEKHKLPYRAPGMLEAVGNLLKWLKDVTDILPEDPYKTALEKKQAHAKVE